MRLLGCVGEHRSSLLNESRAYLMPATDAESLIARAFTAWSTECLCISLA